MGILKFFLLETFGTLHTGIFWNFLNWKYLDFSRSENFIFVWIIETFKIIGILEIIGIFIVFRIGHFWNFPNKIFLDFSEPEILWNIRIGNFWNFPVPKFSKISKLENFEFFQKLEIFVTLHVGSFVIFPNFPIWKFSDLSKSKILWIYQIEIFWNFQIGVFFQLDIIQMFQIEHFWI